MKPVAASEPIWRVFALSRATNQPAERGKLASYDDEDEAGLLFKRLLPGWPYSACSLAAACALREEADCACLCCCWYIMGKIYWRSNTHTHTERAHSERIAHKTVVANGASRDFTAAALPVSTRICMRALSSPFQSWCLLLLLVFVGCSFKGALARARAGEREPKLQLVAAKSSS